MFSQRRTSSFLCGHYKGVDQRVRDHFITREISIGDFVLSGGELAAAVFCDSIIRLIPGVLGNESSALSDSYQDNLTRTAYLHTTGELQRLGSASHSHLWKYTCGRALERGTSF